MVPSKILNLMAFVPAEDFELSRRFYRDLGSQNFHVKEHAGNFM